MAYKLTRQAERDVIQIYLDGASAFGAAQAEAYHARLADAFDLLSENPRMARERAEITPPVRIHPCGAHVIVYLIEAGDDVLIVRVRHGREDWIDDPV